MNFLENDIESSRMIIFFSTCASVNFYFPILKHLLDGSDQANVDIHKLHGKIDQKKRSKIYKQFRETQLDRNEEKKNHLVLLTTDLSSRGIDIPDVDWII
jgi:ATP-dependent RNA helicase DDX55/SPB4